MVINTNNSNIKLYQALLVNMFSNIDIMRADGSMYRIPVYANSFDQQMKRVQEIELEEMNTVKMGMELPAISIEFTDMIFDGQRSLNKMNRHIHLSFNKRRVLASYEDIPVTLTYNLTIATKTATDANSIVEAIQGSFRNNYIKKLLKMPLYNFKEIVTPISILAITPLDDLDVQEGGRDVTTAISLNVKGVLHSYISGDWRTVLDYYRQFKLVDADGDGIIDSYIHPDCDGIDVCGNITDSETYTPVKIGSDQDKDWMKTVVAELAKESGIDYEDLLLRPEIDLGEIGYPIIERILLRVHEKEVTNIVIAELVTSDEHTEEGI